MFSNSSKYFLILIIYLLNKEALVLSKDIEDRQLNIVWFMTESPDTKNMNTNSSAPYLYFTGVVKPCTVNDQDVVFCKAHKSQNRKSIDEKEYICSSRKVQESKIHFFLEWARDKNNMSTALLGVKSSSTSRKKKCQKKRLFNFPINSAIMSPVYRKRKNTFTNEDKIKKPQMYHMKKDANIFEPPVFELFNPEPKLIFNEIDILANDRFADARNVVTILKDDNSGDYEDVVKNDVTIFIKKKVYSYSEKPKSLDVIKEYAAPSKIKRAAFDIVQRVVDIINQMILLNNPRGYVAVIKGGRLEDLTNTNSPLARSIKYVKRQTNENHTLLVLSMLCPNDIAETRTDDLEESDDMLPVFCRGPHCDDFKRAVVLTDLFSILKRRLTQSFSVEVSNNYSRGIIIFWNLFILAEGCHVVLYFFYT